MCGSKPKEQKPSAQEIAYAQASGERSQVHSQDFLPLEIQEIEQYRDPNIERMNRDVIAGRANADVAAAEREALTGLRRNAFVSNTGLSSGANMQRFGDISSATAQGVGMAGVEGARGAQSIRDAEGIGIIRTGNDAARNTMQGLGSLARAEHFKASEKLRAQTLENQARAQALGDIAVASVGGLQERGLRRQEAELRQRMTDQRNRYLQASGEATRDNPRLGEGI